MNVIGIDPGYIRTGVVIMADKDTPVAWATFAADDTAHTDYCRSACIAQKIYDWVWEFIYEEADYHTKFAGAIEVPIYGRSVANFQKQMMTYTMLHQVLSRLCKMGVKVVNPKQAKAAVGVKTNDKRSIVLAAPWGDARDASWLPDNWAGTATQTLVEQTANQEAVADAWAISQYAYKYPPHAPPEIDSACRGPIVEGTNEP